LTVVRRTPYGADVVIDCPTQPPAGLVAAQDVARTISRELVPAIRPGATETGLQREADRIAATHGSTGPWTPVTTRVGIGTLVAHPDFPMQDRAAVVGDTVIVDVTPTIDGWLGDFCVSHVVGEDAEAQALLVECREIQRAMLEAAVPGMPANELYGIGAALLDRSGLKLLDLLDNFGHSIGREFAADGFIDAGNSTPMYGAWTVEPHVGRNARGAKFEDIVWLAGDGTTTRV
jgi:Xaa-Pro dipeptidase